MCLSMSQIFIWTTCILVVFLIPEPSSSQDGKIYDGNQSSENCCEPDWDPGTTEDPEGAPEYVNRVFDENRKVFYDIVSPVLAFGILFNIANILILTRADVPSELTKLLLYNQPVYDIMLIAVSLIILSPYVLQPEPCAALDEFICRFVCTGCLFQVIRLFIVSNVMWFSIDRLLAVRYMTSYKSRAHFYIRICYSSTFAYSFLTGMVSIFLVDYKDCGCVFSAYLKTMTIIVDGISLCGYILPLYVIWGTYVATEKTMKRLHLGTGCEKQTVNVRREVSLSQNGHAENPRTTTCTDTSDDGASNQLIVAVNSIRKNTISFTVLLSIVELARIVMRSLQYAGILNFRFDSYVYYIYVQSVACMSSFTPIIQLSTLPVTKKWINAKFKRMKQCWMRKLSKMLSLLKVTNHNSVGVESGRESTHHQQKAD
ncbi:unnamed protein product [Calicophoron daubneyi]|uniref:G-protein coupled receptors family 1 profile domain-containing protein n=1 Tax=Calicophoron daubneyi TaxID=300641 RepID=A0AAV2TTD6_CALDB